MQAHVAIGVGLLIALSLGSAVAVTSGAVTRRALDSAARDLAAARLAFDRLLDGQGREAAVQASLIAGLPVFRAHLTDPQLAGDAATMDAMAADYRSQLDAAFMIVGSRRTPVTGRAGWPERALSPPVQAALAEAAAGTPSRRLTTADGTLYLVVAAPARFADEVLGAIVVGYVLDDALAGQLSAITRCDVNLVAGRTLAASSLAPAVRRELDALVHESWFTATTEPTVRDVGGGAYVSASYPVSADDIDARLVLLQDWRPTQRSLQEVRLQMALGGIAIFCAALAAALVFSNHVTRALADISQAATATAAGDWTRLVPEKGSAEVQSLARAVNAMATSLNRHHAEVEAQRLRVFRATMTTVHDLVNNFLANMQLIRLEAEDRLPQETIDLFDKLIEDNAAELRMLGELQVVREKEMAVGLGIDYRTAAPGGADPRVSAGGPAA